VDEISETKTPKPGEWWVSGSSLIAYVVGLTLDGDPAWQQKGSRKIMSDEMKFFLACFHHEPRCTGFDWVEPPAEVCRTINVTAGDGWRWVENSEPWLKGDDCLVCDLKQPHTHNSKCWRRRVEPPKPASPDPGEGYEWVHPDDMIASGDEYQVKGGSKDWHRTSAVGIECKSINTYRRRIEPPAPVESPDDWCEITDLFPEHIPRTGIDEWKFANEDWVTEAHYHIKSKTLRDWNDIGSVYRCRRKDLPVTMTLQSVAELCTSEPKRVPVRLFMDERNNVFAVRGEWPIIVGTQIKHDAGDFYAEGQP